MSANNDNNNNDDDSVNSYYLPDTPMPDEPFTMPPDRPRDRWIVRAVARVCLVAAPLLRWVLPQKWQKLSAFNLHNMASTGDDSLVLRYLKYGADPNGVYPLFDAGSRPLESAALYGNVRTTEVLLQAGADINGIDRYGKTALMRAAESGHTELVAFLLDNGARIDDREQLQKHTALFEAAANGHLDVVKLLVARGANITYRRVVGHRFSAAGWARYRGGKSRTECADYLDGLSAPA